MPTRTRGLAMEASYPIKKGQNLPKPPTQCDYFMS
ncbi:hypothetical protein AALP_AA6G155600 [Arabis alpina]|uniref:Uncharacterized protein n=1 Tax=Arabis alpina TaxID=50452 RepID=A0A087GPF7_ARAAL|nr:hypothetical protein AALP_AA6G155600 [Arabis alpina]